MITILDLKAEFEKLTLLRGRTPQMTEVERKGSGAFVEGLSCCECDFFPTLQLHHDGALQDVHNRMGIVSVARARPAGCMLYRDRQSFPTGTLRKIFRHERRDLRLLSHRRAGHEA